MLAEPDEAGGLLQTAGLPVGHVGAELVASVYLVKHTQISGFESEPSGSLQHDLNPSYLDFALLRILAVDFLEAALLRNRSCSKTHGERFS